MKYSWNVIVLQGESRTSLISMSCFDGKLGYLIFVVTSHFTTKIPETFQAFKVL